METTLTVSSTIIPSGDIAGLWTLPFFILFVVFIVWTTVLLGDSIRQLCHNRVRCAAWVTLSTVSQSTVPRHSGTTTVAAPRCGIVRCCAVHAMLG